MAKLRGLWWPDNFIYIEYHLKGDIHDVYLASIPISEPQKHSEKVARSWKKTQKLEISPVLSYSSRQPRRRSWLDIYVVVT